MALRASSLRGPHNPCPLILDPLKQVKWPPEPQWCPYRKSQDPGYCHTTSTILCCCLEIYQAKGRKSCWGLLGRPGHCGLRPTAVASSLGSAGVVRGWDLLGQPG